MLDAELEYEHKGQRRKGGFWMEHGVAVGTGINDAKELRFTVFATGDIRFEAIMLCHF